MLTAVFLLCSVALAACSSGSILSENKPVRDISAESSQQVFVDASLKNIKGDHRGAIQGYLKLLKAQPENAAVNYAISKSYVGLGKPDSARYYAEKALQLEPSNKHYLKYLAALSHRMNDFSRASVLFRKLADLEPGNIDDLSLLALEYLSADQPEKSLEIFQEILRLDPKNKATRAQVLLMEIQLSHYKDAIGTVSGLIDKSDGQEKLRLTLGELYIQTGQYELAYKTFRELIGDNPEFIPAWLSLLEVSVKKNENTVFANDLDQFYSSGKIPLKQKIDLANFFLVRSSRDTTFTAPARTMISEISRHYPSNSEVLMLSARFRIQQKEAVAAEQELRKALTLNSEDIDIWEELISSLFVQKKFREARELVYRIKKHFPALKTRNMVIESEVLFQTGRYKNCAKLLEKALVQKDIRKEKWLFVQAATILAFCYDRLDLPDKSIDIYEKILEVDPGNNLMMNNLAYVLAQQGKELLKAKELSVKAVRAEPANAGFIDTLGWIYYMQGEYESARETLEKAAALNGNEPEILEHLAEVYEKLGNPQKARELKEQAIKLRSR
ncbi:MAG: tetratricopeptide repeat protein [Chlorobiaceae bacterium]|nr:tetratricopeptide repeat protein [Chlorobiaceae bacterium]